MSETRNDHWLHPSFCVPELCTVQYPDIAHRQVPELIVPRGDPRQRRDPDTPAVTWAIERDDEIDRRDRQVGNPPTIALGVGSEVGHLSLDEAAVVGASLLAQVAQARGRSFGVIPGTRSEGPPAAVEPCRLSAVRDAS